MNISLYDAIRAVAAVAAVGVLVAVLASFTKKPEEPKPAPAEHDPSNPFDPARGSGHLVAGDAPRDTEKWPKTYKAPDGVNTITERRDGTGSVTALWVPKPKPDEVVMRNDDYTHTWVILEEAVKKQGKHVITQADAEEVQVLIRDSLNAHYFALEFYETAMKTTGKPEEQAALWENIRRVTVNSKRLIEAEAKWRKRVEEGRP